MFSSTHCTALLAGWRTLALIAAALLSLSGCRKSESARPPIVLVVIDTLRADYLGCYGFQGPISPEIDDLAHQAVVFENCSAPSPWTKPSVASLFTSAYPETHHVLTERGLFRNREPSKRTTELDALSDDFRTIAETLHDAGYVSAAFVANPWISPQSGYGQGFVEFHGEPSSPVPQGELKRPGAALVAAARQYLEQRAADPTTPFFLYLHLMEVHGPYDAAEADFEAVKDSASLGDPLPLPPPEVKRIPPYLRRPQWTADPAAANVRVWRGRYAAGVRAADRHVGALRQALRDTGLLERALFIVTSDHGEQLFDHRAWDHGYSLFEHQLHVPLIIRMPGQSEGRRVKSLVNLIDLVPTLAGWLGQPREDGWQGRDLSPVLRGGDLPASESFASAAKWRPKLASMRTDRYKVIIGGGTKKAQLYDLEKDPREQENLAASDPDRLRALRQRLVEHRRMVTAEAPSMRSPVPVSAAEQERLRNLGYLEDK